MLSRLPSFLLKRLRPVGSVQAKWNHPRAMNFETSTENLMQSVMVSRFDGATEVEQQKGTNFSSVYASN